MDYLGLKIAFNQGKLLQNSLSTGEMTLEVAYSLLLCVSSYSWFYDSGVAKLFPASADQCDCDQAGVTVLWSHVTANDPLLVSYVWPGSSWPHHVTIITPRLCN